MMESEWDKYDLRQTRPKNMDELTAAIALSHGLAVNPYIYTYLKIQGYNHLHIQGSQK